jgi:F-type H+-transporting ATPase subunit alpha
LEPNLFFAGVKPAMNAGISVSRVGSAAQVKAMKKVAGGLRLDLAAFRELEAFAQMGTDVDAATQARLDRGYRMVELLKQGQYVPLNVIDQVLVIYAGTRGHLDKIPANQVQDWEKQFLTFIHNQKQEIWDEVEQKRDLSDDLVQKIESAIKEFQSQYAHGGAEQKKTEKREREPVAV